MGQTIIMDIWVDGGCRRNGAPDAIGACAAIFRNDFGYSVGERTFRLPANPRPTSARAEIHAIILALKGALGESIFLDPNPDESRFTIHSDSEYAVNCIRVWRSTWERNGWALSNGSAVANQDLLREAYELVDDVTSCGSLQIVWVPRSENRAADAMVNRVLDEMEEERRGCVVAEDFHSSAWST